MNTRRRVGLIHEAHAALRAAVDALESESESEREAVWDSIIGGPDDVSILTKLELWLAVVDHPSASDHRIEAVAQAMFEAENPGRSWDAERAKLSEPRSKSYSQAPYFRHLAEIALDKACKGC